MTGAAGSLWTCPDCGRSFANLNQAHACQDTTIDEALTGLSDLARSIYAAVVGALEAAGEFRIHAQKSRIAFISRMTFASVMPAKSWVDLSLILAEPVDDPRVRRLDMYGPTSWGHRVRLSSPQDVDERVRGWLAQALRRGDQETLASSAPVTSVPAGLRQVFNAPFRGRVVTFGEGLGIPVPGYLADALGGIGEVSMRLASQVRLARVFRHDERWLLSVDDSLRLREGDDVDVNVTLRLR